MGRKNTATNARTSPEVGYNLNSTSGFNGLVNLNSTGLIVLVPKRELEETN